jgi:hypothetical protein
MMDDDDALHPKAKHLRLDPLGGETSTLSSNLAVILTNPESIQTMGDKEYYHMPVEHPSDLVGRLLDGSTGMVDALERVSYER